MDLKFSVGNLTLHRIVEQQTPFMPILDMLPELTGSVLEHNRNWLEEVDAVDRNEAVFCFQSYIIQTPQHVIVVDGAIGNGKKRHRELWHMQASDIYIRSLAAAGLSVDDVDYVMCTHLHPDHVGWNTRLEDGTWVPTFPYARYVFGAAELGYWTKRNEVEEVPCIVDSVMPIVEAGRYVTSDQDFTLGDYVRVLATPGHTPGHQAYLFGKGKDLIVCSGDLMHSPLQVRYPELSPRFDVDRETSARTRRAFLERYCDTDTLCCPAHFPLPRRIRRGEQGFAFEAF